ncbi:lactonase family protein [Pelagicoccus enzymogenes]|uniref:lactonase family protein n=1 Tax=Pelagicoccus enzymogenes TaxID=2773457 RepID=UPI00280F7C37|nr:lactonase family protein [Pelagicoccus enzymogenes]MDQ8200248.1 lactonase family protein [Pelagicoccus enzymogenes]
MKYLSPFLFTVSVFVSSTALKAETLWIAAEGGVYRSELNEQSGELSVPELAAAFDSGSFLAIHPHLDVLYASYRDDSGAGYASLVPSGDAGRLQLQSVQRVSSGNAHLSVSENGRLLAGAHYGEGVNYVLELEADGAISDRWTRLVQSGSGPERPQSQARPHWVTFAKKDSLLHSVDLGTDEIWTYGVGKTANSVQLLHKVKFPAGTGPRHMALVPDSNAAYVSGELNLDVNTFFYDEESGRFSPLQYISTVEAPFPDKQISLSEIQVHPSGRFVYTAVRGLDLMVAYAVDPATGLLSLVEREDARVHWPRNFTVSSSGTWLIVAGQRSHELRVFEIDPKSGELSPTESRIELQSPVCVRAWNRM